jgi:RND family efflux transporter MFP subunit
MLNKKTAKKIIIPLIIILASFVIMKLLIADRPEPKKEVRRDPGILVQVMKAERNDIEVVIHGTGTVEAAEEISIIPQVSGRIIYASPNLDVGGFFKTGELLFEIEDTDYRLALERSLSVRSKAEYELASIESQAQIARAEWARINTNNNIPPNPLVLFEPQLKSAKSELASATASVKQAKLDLERTKMKSPFNSRVRSENIDLGQYVKNGTGVAVLAGTDTAEISVPLSLDDISWLRVPHRAETATGSPATVFLNIRNKQYEWQGSVVRSTGEVDTKSRMMQLVVEISDPYGLARKQTLHPTLAVGTFVDVSIKGKKLKNVFVIPRMALRDDSTIWIMDKDSGLQIREITPVRIERENIIVSDGINDGDLIILSNISGAANGMKLRSMEQ